MPKKTSRAEGGWVVGCQGSASRASTGAVRRIHDKRIPPFSCPRWRLTCRIPCVPRPRQEPRGSYLKPPAIEAGGGWVRRGGAFSRASGPIRVAWPRPAAGGLQSSNDALVTLAPASGLGTHILRSGGHNNITTTTIPLPPPLLELLLARVSMCWGLRFLCACLFALFLLARLLVCLLCSILGLFCLAWLRLLALVGFFAGLVLCWAVGLLGVLLLWLGLAWFVLAWLVCVVALLFEWGWEWQTGGRRGSQPESNVWLVCRGLGA